jgi:hypothetical protein
MKWLLPDDEIAPAPAPADGDYADPFTAGYVKTYSIGTFFVR